MTDEWENRSQLQKQYQTLLSQVKTDFNIELFTSYFREITKVLTEEDDEMIDFLAFYNYMKLPMFIAKAIYKSFVLGYDFIPISSDDFVKYLSYLYAGGIELKLRMVFKIFDIDKDSTINKNDVQLIFYHLHSSLNISDKNENDIEDIIVNFFSSSSIMNYEQFKQCVIQNNSDLFFLFYYFLFKFKPFNDLSLDHYSERIMNQTRTENHSSTDLDCLHKPSIYLYEYLRIDQKCEFSELNDFETSVASLTKTLNKEKIVKFKSQKDLGYSIPGKPEPLEEKRKSNKSQIFETICINNKNGSFSNTFHMTFLDSLPKSKKEVNGFLETSDFYSAKCLDSKNEKVKVEIVGNDILVYYKNKEQHKYIFRQLIPIKDISAEFEKDNKSVYLISTINNRYSTCSFSFKSSEEAEHFSQIINSNSNFVQLESEYFVDSIIGKGCFGTVVKGENIATHEKVAIKVMKKTFENIESLTCARNEEDVLRFLMMNPHKNVIHIKNIMESLKAIYIIQEYVPKGNLETFTYSHLNSFHPNDKLACVIDILKQIAEGMNHYMSYGIIHRDMKPQNILIDIHNGHVEVKIIDFGFSTVLFRNELVNQKYGTLLYLAPEIVDNHFYNNKVDIWSFSLIAYFLLYGKHFFMLDSMDEIRDKIDNIEEFLPLLSNNPTLKSVRLHQIMSRCLSKRMQERPSIHELSALLQTL